MAQELTVKVTNPDGTSSMKKIYVIRAWQESSGKQIFLFANGVYGYKDESPVRSESEFDAIHNKQQKQAAIFWWKKTGAEYSARFYAEQEAKAAEKAGVYQFELQVPRATSTRSSTCVNLRRRARAPYPTRIPG